ncbi:MAG: hypothetical protein NC110_03530 [Ruminococcus sp.]|nr:hypothetical protein [Ruminococcus sp.]
MKKLLSVLLCIIMACSACTVAFAAEPEDDWSDYPVIVVPGYSSSSLYRLDENGNQVHVWGIDMDEIIQAILKNIVQIGIGIGELTKGNAKYIAEKVGKEFIRMYGDMACNPDGSSVYDLKRYCITAEQCNSANLDELYENGRFQHEAEIMGEYAQYVGKENIYNFNCDFRMGAVFCATQLDEFIQSVKEYSGKDKVNIFAVSHGGQVTGTYLTLFGEKGDVNNAVMTVPALGGAGLAYDILNGDVDFDEAGLLVFIEHGMMEETDYNWLTRANELGFLDNVIDELIPYVKQVLGYWGSIWDFAPTEYYEALKEKCLDKTESAELIKKSDYMHYEVMPDFANGFKRAQQAGEHVYIIAGYDSKIVTGLNESSDAIITIAASTGATPAPLGKRFADGYTQKVDTGFYQVSPSMTVDASTSYMPEHTWFVENFYHGMIYKDPYTAELLRTLLLTDKISDVHSDARFPQFHATTNKSHSVFAAFNNSTEGYVSSEDTSIIVKNLSEKYKMNVLAVSARGVDIKFKNSATITLNPGESIEIPFSGKLPEVSKANFDVVVDYSLIGSITPLGERLFNFTLMNGEAVPYDEGKPFVDANYTSNFNDLPSKDVSDTLNKVGITSFFEMIYNILETWFSTLFKFVRGVVGK